MNSTRNISDPKETLDRLTLNSVTGVLFMIFYVTVFLLSLVGNSLVLLVCYKSLRGRRGFESVKGPFFNQYIANLAVSDLLFTILTLFDAMYTINGEWMTGIITCKTQGFLLETCYTASILTLIAISRERVTAIASLEMSSRVQRGKERRVNITIVWLLAIVICSPLLFAYTLYDDNNGFIKCRNMNWGDTGRRVYYSLTAVLLFLFPLFLMAWSHVKINRVLKSQVAPSEHMLKAIRTRQKKASRILLMVIMVFFLFWSPFIVMRTLRYFRWYNAIGPWKFVQLVVIASSATNPFVYCFYSVQFRRLFKTFVTCRCTGLTRNDTNTTSEPSLTNAAL
ncbi:QRFP-like peptide receptor [Nematostella vectensis]|uniref:QRFP-like peptide receptor n=1 Tax=Nematostella vectensis TaxID=45351 RepID=UPI0013901A02|nr:QRFP-like peptide receptor [Nematostella vectensis]